MEKREGRGKKKIESSIFSLSYCTVRLDTSDSFFPTPFLRAFVRRKKKVFAFLSPSPSHTHCHPLSGTTATKGDNKYRVLCEREMGPSPLLLQAAAAFATADRCGPSAGRAIVCQSHHGLKNQHGDFSVSAICYAKF